MLLTDGFPLLWCADITPELPTNFPNKGMVLIFQITNHNKLHNTSTPLHLPFTTPNLIISSRTSTVQWGWPHAWRKTATEITSVFVNGSVKTACQSIRAGHFTYLMYSKQKYNSYTLKCKYLKVLNFILCCCVNSTYKYFVNTSFTWQVIIRIWLQTSINIFVFTKSTRGRNKYMAKYNFCQARGKSLRDENRRIPTFKKCFVGRTVENKWHFKLN